MFRRGSYVVATLWVVAVGAVVEGAAAPAAKKAPDISVESAYIFTDAKAVIHTAVPVKEQVEYTLKTITAQGEVATKEGTAKVTDGRFEVEPVGEAIHIVTLKLDKPLEVRFLALRPPTPLDDKAKAALLAALPRNGKKLLDGQDYTLLALGDSVTSTGRYDEMLGMILGRATGNQKIKVVKPLVSRPVGGCDRARVQGRCSAEPSGSGRADVWAERAGGGRAVGGVSGAVSVGGRASGVRMRGGHAVHEADAAYRHSGGRGHRGRTSPIQRRMRSGRLDLLKPWCLWPAR